MKRLNEKTIIRLNLSPKQVEDINTEIATAEKWMYEKFTNMLTEEQHAQWRQIGIDLMTGNNEDNGYSMDRKINPYQVKPCPNCGAYANGCTRGIPIEYSCPEGHKWLR